MQLSTVYLTQLIRKGDVKELHRVINTGVMSIMTMYCFISYCGVSEGRSVYMVPTFKRLVKNNIFPFDYLTFHAVVVNERTISSMLDAVVDNFILVESTIESLFEYAIRRRFVHHFVRKTIVKALCKSKHVSIPHINRALVLSLDADMVELFMYILLHHPERGDALDVENETILKKACRRGTALASAIVSYYSEMHGDVNALEILFSRMLSMAQWCGNIELVVHIEQNWLPKCK